jgi:hypothetical protein
MEDEDDFREFRELERRYAEATVKEREHLRPHLERAVHKIVPGLFETADKRFFNGDYLKDMFDQCMQRVLARPDLTPDRKTNAMEDAATFREFFEAAKQWQVPKLAAHAFELATCALFTGLRAGLNQDEVDKLRRNIFVEEGRKGGIASRENRKERLWWPRAKELALKADPNLSNEKIAMYLRDNWAPKEKQANPLPKCPGHRTLTKFVSTLRADKKIPQRRGSFPS